MLWLATTLAAQTGILNSNKIVAEVHPENKLYGNTGCEYPKGTSKYAFGETSVWLKGVNSNNDTFISANLTGNNTSDFQSGPLSSDGTQGADPQNWNNVYVVDRNAVNYHLSNFYKSGYQKPAAISNWPGNGPNGYTRILAPFVDWNANQEYQPDSGDSPYLFGEQMAYSVFNDRAAHNLTNSSPMGLELHSLTYQFEPSQLQEFDNFIVNELVIFNRSTENYDPFTLSVTVDFILGDDKDNFIGTNVKERYFYCYNGDADDAAYGAEIPCLVIFPLDDDSFASSLYLTKNDHIQSGMPKSRAEFMNFSNGLWRNGSKLTFGSDGLDGTLECKYIYPGDTDPDFSSQNWTEGLAGNDPGHRAALLNFSGNSLNSGSSMVKNIGYFILHDYSGNTSDITSYVNNIRDLFSQGRYTSVKSEIKPLNLYPNPVQQGGTIQLSGVTGRITKVEIYNLIGVKVWETNELNNKKLELNDDIPKGVYLVKVSTDSSSYLGKFTIQ